MHSAGKRLKRLLSALTAGLMLAMALPSHADSDHERARQALGPAAVDGRLFKASAKDVDCDFHGITRSEKVEHAAPLGSPRGAKQPRVGSLEGRRAPPLPIE